MRLQYLFVSLFTVASFAAPEIVEFRIKAGTGKGPWNTRETVKEVKVGQVLRIYNDDTIPHQLHTNDDIPCPHQVGVSRPGEFYSCFISTTVDPDVDELYDHNFGAQSRFYLRATN